MKTRKQNMNTSSESDKTSLYVHYEGQVNAQDAYLQVESNGDITADVNSEPGNGIPAPVWSNRVVRLQIPNTLTHAGIRDLVEDYSEELLILVNGMSDEWDGSNLQGYFSDEAIEVLGRLKRLLMEVDPEQYEHFCIEDAESVSDDDLLGDFIIRADMTDADLEEIGEQILDEWSANCGGEFVIVRNLEGRLQEIRDDMREELED